MKAKKYTLKEPTPIEAIQWSGDNCAEIAQFMGLEMCHFSESMNSNVLKVGVMRVPIGDYIVHDSEDGTFKHYQSDEFNDKYKPLKR